MSNIKKIIGVVLALVMVLSMASVAFAAEGDYYEISFNVVDGKTELAPGESTTIEVNLTTNFYASAISIPIFFDNSQVDVVATSKLAKDEDQADRVNIADDNSDPDAIKKFYESVPHTPDTASLRAFVYVGKYYDQLYKYDNYTVMTLTVTAKEDAKSSVVIFDCIEEAIKTTTHPSGALYVAKNSSGSDEVDSMGEVIDDARITTAIANITIKADDVVNTLVIEDDAPVTPYIDYTNGESAGYTAFIYGIDTLGWNDDFTPDATLDECLTTTLGDDYLVIEDVGGNETTGTIIKVLDADGDTVLETYVFIYFGDVDMDGSIGFSDAFMCEYYEMNYEGFDTLYQFMAGDLDGDGMPGLSDAYFCEYYEMNYEGMPSQAEVAALAYDIPYEIF
ncbi:MAG: hypothetical protein J1F24_01890 [Oscillospiraceae bacterium]|nr:hypothetical protein [Oscillospiraceae bacterium]